MKVLSLFSGVGGFDLGLENAGMETVFQCEWDKHATKILERHWPHIPRWDDVSTLTGEHILRHAPVIDVVAWGSPCQDLSVAGKRAGLQGARSGLFHEGVRIIEELRSLTNGKYPRISIWENVAGALSSGAGADFGQVLTEMDEAGACFSEWRILDAQYFGVPQRRRRVFLISVFDTATAARCPDPLLPVSEGVQWHPQTSNQARQTVASAVANCLRVGSGVGERGDGSDNLVVEPSSFGSSNFGGWAETDTATTLSQRDHKGSMTMVVGSLAARDYKGVGSQYVDEGKVVVEAFTKGKRPQTSTDDETWDENRPAPTINAFDQGDTRATTVIVEDPVLLTMREGKPGGGKGPLLSTDKSLSLRTGNEQTLFAPVAFDGYNQTISDVSQTIRADKSDGDHVGMVLQAVAYGLQGNMIGRQDHNGPQGAGISHPDDPMFSLTSTDRHAVAFDGYNQTISDVTQTIRADKSDGDHVGMVFNQPTMAVRRLTPLECERLMGWPDDWTAGQSDTHRYKQCGNGVASPVAQWIGQQLMELDK
jgi:DNA (cytosine-5)-methyltransferase 1